MTLPTVLAPLAISSVAITANSTTMTMASTTGIERYTDKVLVNGHWALVQSVDSSTQITLASAWTGGTVSGGSGTVQRFRSSEDAFRLAHAVSAASRRITENDFLQASDLQSTIGTLNRVRLTVDGSNATWLATHGGTESGNLAIGWISDLSKNVTKIMQSISGTVRTWLNQYGFQISSSELATNGNNTLTIANTSSVPTSNVAGGIFYIESGVAKYRASDGTITPFGDVATGENARSGRRNFFQNGGCLVWQRGVSFSGSYSYAATADGFYPYNNSGSGRTYTILQVDTDAASVSYGVRSRKAYRMEVTNAGSGVASCGLILRFTADHVISGKNVSLSYKCRTNITGLGHTAFLYNNRSGTTLASAFVSSSVPDRDEYWRSGHMVFNVANNADIKPTDSLSVILFTLPTASTGYVEVTDVQFELGKHLTPFEVSNLADDLARCQLHYEVVGLGATGIYNAATQLALGIRFRVSKRSTPTISLKSGTHDFDESGVALHTITPSLVSSAATTEGVFANIGGFTGRTVQNCAIPKVNFIVADTGL